MDTDIKKIMEFADRLSVIENQKELLLKQFEESCMTYHNGHQITINPTLIATVKNYFDLGRTQNISVLDDFNLPVVIEDTEKFLNFISDQYQQALQKYQIEYNLLIEKKGDLDA